MRIGFYDVMLVIRPEEINRAKELARILDTGRSSGPEIMEAFALRAKLFKRARRTLVQPLLSGDFD